MDTKTIIEIITSITTCSSVIITLCFTFWINWKQKKENKYLKNKEIFLDLKTDLDNIFEIYREIKINLYNELINPFTKEKIKLRKPIKERNKETWTHFLNYLNEIENILMFTEFNKILCLYCSFKKDNKNVKYWNFWFLKEEWSKIFDIKNVEIKWDIKFKCHLNFNFQDNICIYKCPICCKERIDNIDAEFGDLVEESELLCSI